MAIEQYVKQILDSPAYLFDEIIGKIIGKNIDNAKIELIRYTTNVDNVLFDAIKSILIDLEEEENFISRFLYSLFGLELRRNKRREQLILLGGQLKTQHNKVKSELFRVYRQSERLSLSIIDLKRLRDSFYSKSLSFESAQMLNKSTFYINEIEAQLRVLDEYKLSLELKHNNIKDVELLYASLLRKIPRYHELQEERYLRMLPS
jgi:hypothetical protein